MSPVSFLIALAVVIATLSVSRVEGYYTYYYFYYYYTDQPKQCTSFYYDPNTIKACPISSCHCSLTYDNCCLRYFTYKGVLYKQCICSSYTTCAPTNSTIDNPPPPTTQSSTTTTTPTTITSTTTTTTTTPTTTTTTTPTTTSTTTPTTTSTTPTTTTTTTPTTTTTTTPTTTSTTTPTTTSTTTTPTTTSTTTSTTTPPPFRSLCDSGFRLLNGESATTCDFNGVANITTNTSSGTVAACSAVYTYATVNGVYKLTFLTASICKTFIESQNNTLFEIQIEKQRIPVISPLFTLVEGPNGAAFIDINSLYANLLSDLGCQKGACPYNNATMEKQVDFNNCKIVGWGAADADSLSSNGLNEAKIALNPGGCTNITDAFGAANTLCFKTISGSALICARDTGSPIYCQAPSNGEWILVASSAFQRDCGDSPEVKGIPYPG